jgi:hypothetical protein
LEEWAENVIALHRGRWIVGGMPLVDKLERIGALLQNGTLSPEEFHQAKDHILKTAAPGTNPPGAANLQRPQMDAAARKRAEREYHHVRHHCMVRDRHYALREPSVSYLAWLSIALVAWIGLGSVVVAGFHTLNPTLAVIPIGTILIGCIFMLGSICTHAAKVIRLRMAKRKYYKN